ncbi:uncharacterized protein METZ01_LOCUS487481 [marine metagenome]|uniref:Uncharacterized protein n=1 Tax=marine metagenome TaxID=408172 RepID=A0A383CQJ1_9ZZZZ
MATFKQVLCLKTKEINGIFPVGHWILPGSFGGVREIIAWIYTNTRENDAVDSKQDRL